MITAQVLAEFIREKGWSNRGAAEALGLDRIAHKGFIRAMVNDQLFMQGREPERQYATTDPKYRTLGEGLMKLGFPGFVSVDQFLEDVERQQRSASSGHAGLSEPPFPKTRHAVIQHPGGFLSVALGPIRSPGKGEIVFTITVSESGVQVSEVARKKEG